MIHFLIVFIVYFVMDVLYAFYTYKIVERKPFWAANIAGSIYVLACFGILNVVANPWNLIAVFLGSWIGTYVVVKYKK